MAKHGNLGWTEKALLALAGLGAFGSFLIGIVLIGNLYNPESSEAEVEKIQNPNKANNKTSELSGLVVQRNQSFKKIIDLLDKETRLDFNVPKQFQGQIVKQAKLFGTEKIIALTFDDGPWPKWTDKVLEILKKNNIKATFFVVGQVLQEYPAIGKKIVVNGHEIANHTWTHRYRNMDEATASREIDRTSELIYKVTGAKTSVFRPPGGFLNNGLVAYAKKKNYVVAMWSSDSIDYRRLGAERLATNVLRNADSGGIVLMHDGGGDRSQTVKALPQIIATLKKRGFRFVTMTELLEMQEKEQKLIAVSKLLNKKVILPKPYSTKGK